MKLSKPNADKDKHVSSGTDPIFHVRFDVEKPPLVDDELNLNNQDEDFASAEKFLYNWNSNKRKPFFSDKIFSCKSISSNASKYTGSIFDQNPDTAEKSYPLQSNLSEMKSSPIKNQWSNFPAAKILFEPLLSSPAKKYYIETCETCHLSNKMPVDPRLCHAKSRYVAALQGRCGVCFAKLDGDFQKGDVEIPSHTSMFTTESFKNQATSKENYANLNVPVARIVKVDNRLQANGIVYDNNTKQNCDISQINHSHLKSFVNLNQCLANKNSSELSSVQVDVSSKPTDDYNPSNTKSIESRLQSNDLNDMQDLMGAGSVLKECVNADLLRGNVVKHKELCKPIGVDTTSYSVVSDTKVDNAAQVIQTIIQPERNSCCDGNQALQPMPSDEKQFNKRSSDMLSKFQISSEVSVCVEKLCEPYNIKSENCQRQHPSQSVQPISKSMKVSEKQDNVVSRDWDNPEWMDDELPKLNIKCKQKRTNSQVDFSNRKPKHMKSAYSLMHDDRYDERSEIHQSILAEKRKPLDDFEPVSSSSRYLDSDLTTYGTACQPNKHASQSTDIDKSKKKENFIFQGATYFWPYLSPSVPQLTEMPDSDNDDIDSDAKYGEVVIVLTRLEEEGYVPKCFINASMPNHTCCRCCKLFCCSCGWDLL